MISRLKVCACLAALLIPFSAIILFMMIPIFGARLDIESIEFTSGTNHYAITWSSGDIQSTNGTTDKKWCAPIFTHWSR